MNKMLIRKLHSHCLKNHSEKQYLNYNYITFEDFAWINPFRTTRYPGTCVPIVPKGLRSNIIFFSHASDTQSKRF